jgi:glycosyltransferase involved in cell wall biosynthesis
LKIAYVGTFYFPEGDAGAARVLGIARALRENGHSVVFLGIEKTPTDRIIGKNTRNGIVSGYQGFKYRSPNPPSTDIIGKLARQCSVLSGGSVLRRLKTEILEDGPVDAVIAYQSPSLLLIRLMKLCKSMNIPLICDIVEWYDPEHIFGGRLGLMTLDSELSMKRLHFLCDGVIVISNYLRDFYGEKKSSAMCIPPLVDVLSDEWSRSCLEPKNTRLRLAFVGNAGRKDLLVNAIRGLDLLGVKALECEIIMVGPSPEEVRTNLGKDASLIEKLEGRLHFTGRLPRKEALTHLAQADFSILLRPDARFAHAGFPTKLVESLAMGVPIICNLTSDIGLYIRDGREGIVIGDSSPKAFAQGVRRALALKSEEKKSMRLNAKRCAESCFDFRNWVKLMSNFFEDVIVRYQQGTVCKRYPLTKSLI